MMEKVEFPNEQPEHKQVRQMLERQYELGKMTVEQCTDFIQEWIEITGGPNERVDFTD